MFDYKTINTINAEDRHQLKEERQLKNHILNMSNTERKQELWQKYFPKVVMADDYLEGNIF